MYSTNGRDIIGLRLDIFFTTFNEKLPSYPYYQPDINFTKVSDLTYSKSNGLGGERTYNEVYALDEGDKYIIEYEVSFKDTGLFGQLDDGMSSIVCCQSSKCQQTTIGETTLHPLWTMNNTGKRIGGISLFLNGEELQIQYPIYVIP